MWCDWLKINNVHLEGMPLEAIAYYRHVYYASATQMYNTLMTVIRQDHSLQAFAVVTEAVRVNLEQYFQDEGTPHTLN